MSWRLPATVLCTTAVLLLPGTAAAQTEDSVSLTGVATTSNFTVTTLTATSGPSGEDASGQVAFQAFGIFFLSGPVTCLAVDGTTATLNFQDAGFGITTVQVTDGQPDTFDAAPLGRAATDCSPLPPGLGGAVSGGDITVVDALPLPTTKDQCKHGGWQSYGVFKNQGDCVSFVATGGRNAPGGG